MRPNLHIVFACGGTSGYLNPGLAVAAHVKQRMPAARLTFVGTGKPVERHPVRAAGYEYVTMPAQPVPRNPFRAMRFITDNVAGYWATRWFLREQHVSLVVGLGGYASAATVRAATSRQIPTAILEQNAVPSHVTRWLARSVDMVCAGFDDVRSYLPAQTPLVVTGNPARPAFERLYRQQSSGFTVQGSDDDDANAELRTLNPLRRLVVIGGYGGARSLNEFMPPAARDLGDRLSGWQVVHQTGEGQLQQTIDRYQDAGVDALVVSYIDEMAPVMYDSDLVVCRAAGTTLAELALAGVPAVLVPYPRDAEAYQLANAELVAAAGAASMIDETTLDGTLDEALVAHLAPLVTDAPRRHAMAVNMRSLARPDAAALITDTICDVLGIGAARLAA
jgi:UDP-N-acetylglucosamine--N-acetylmuramyl-(pentapeptide) pyrophosphoryl-undecaprenol N-acetylglucosamine transferase